MTSTLRSDSTSARRAAREGARDITPVVLGVMPLAVVIGVAAHHAAVNAGAAWAASFLLCAGTAQLTAIQLLGSGAAPLAIVATTTLINSRFVVYSAQLARWFEHERLHRRMLLAFPLVDQLFVVCQRRFTTDDTPEARRWYYVGAAVTLVVTWSAVQALALVFAGSIPDVGVLRLAAPLVFVGLLTQSVKNRSHATAAAVGATVAVLASPALHQLNIVAGIVAGVAAAAVVARTER